MAFFVAPINHGSVEIGIVLETRQATHLPEVNNFDGLSQLTMLTFFLKHIGSRSLLTN